MHRFIGQVKGRIEFYNGVDLLDSFAPTVLEDKTLLNSATASVICKHFQQWRATASQQEQGIPIERAEWAQSGRYRSCLTVDEEDLLSVLNAPPVGQVNETGFVILINGKWVPEVMDEEELKG